MTTLLNFLFGTNIAHAAGSTTKTAVSPLATFIGKIDRLIINPLITLMFAAALVYFLYGVMDFILNGASPEAREKGQESIKYGLIGMFIMFAVYAIIALIQKTIGADALQISR